MENSQPELNIMDYIYPKKFECPVCNVEFESYVVKRSKLRVKSRDTDLRTTYYYLDPGLYDVVMCTQCGYAALMAYFDRITDKQVEIIKENIAPKYVHRDFPIPLSLEHAIDRYKMALLCAATTNAKSSLKAILCLKIAWLYRDLQEKNAEMQYLHNALTGLKEAYGSENFPLAGMDEYTAQLTIAELSRRIGESSEALRWISSLITSKGVPFAIKDRAVDIKELIREG